ncbi:MAG: transporter substrate-binding domain-containing protein [Oscillospiraceae bacterium]|nr:transporter substrate-binding domain-containing protein [Oscillospiraceae bacterium]
MRRITAIIMTMLMMLSLSAGAFADGVPSGVEDGVLTIAMECAYAPYNWTQSDDSNGAVPIVNVPGSYANGYDVMIGQKICEANGWQLEVIQSDWDSLVPGVQTGTFDAVIAGQSMTAERAEQVDFAGPYFYATIVCLTRADSPYANATSLSDLSGGSCTAQIATIWYDTCLPQIEGANVMTAAETAPAMLMALETGMVDFVCTDMPTAQGAVAAYPDMVILDFSGTDGDFQFTEQERAENVNIGISMMKGNTVLHEAIDSVLSTMTVEDFNELMAHAIEIQPLSED